MEVLGSYEWINVRHTSLKLKLVLKKFCLNI